MSQQMPEHDEVKKLTLNQDDFIEWVLKNTNDKKAEFRIYQGKHHTIVGIDAVKWTDPILDILDQM